MEVAINRGNCGNCQLCADACPEVFDVQQGEIAILCEDVPLAFETDCLYARDACPEHAIEVSGSGGIFRDH